MFDVDAFFYIKFFLLSACQERFQDVFIALDFLDQDTQVLHALAKKSSPRDALTNFQSISLCVFFMLLALNSFIYGIIGKK